MKKYLSLFLAALMLVFASACGKKDTVSAEPVQEKAEVTAPSNELEAKDEKTVKEAKDKKDKEGKGKGNGNKSINADNIFAKMPESFLFASGAGGWGTELKIHDDGSFEGSFHDSNYEFADDGTAIATVMFNNFSGKFTDVKKLSDYVYSVRLEYLNDDGPTEDYYDYEQDIQYYHYGPYGMENTDEFLIYLPGARLSDLPEEFVGWLRGTALYDKPNAKTLPCWGLYNVGEQLGFSGED